MAPLAPGPDPNPCHTNCGAVYVDGAKKEEITCPCGFGYYDCNGDFVSGSLVRQGKKPTRAEYIAHVEKCAHKESGRPILHEDRSGGLVYQGARDTRGVVANARTSATPIQAISSSQPSRHYQTASNEDYATARNRDADNLSPSRPTRDQKPNTEQSRTTAETAGDAAVKDLGGNDYFPSSRRPTMEDIVKLKNSSQFVEDAEQKRLGMSRHNASNNTRDATPPVNRPTPQGASQSHQLSSGWITNSYTEHRLSADTHPNPVSISQQLPPGLERYPQFDIANESRVTPSRHQTAVSERDRHSTAQTASRRISEQTYDRELAVSVIPQPGDSDRELSRQERQELDHHRRSRHDSVVEEEIGQGMAHDRRTVRIQRTVDGLELESKEDNKRDPRG